MVGDISLFTICVARFLISHVRFYPTFTLLLDVTLPLLFSELGKICKKSGDIIPVKRTGSKPLFPFCQPKSKGDLTGDLAR
jgi:hypothetical protein